MKKQKKKLRNIIISSVLLCIVVGGSNYFIKNSTKNSLIRNLYDSLELKGQFDEETLKDYNAKNMQKLENGQELTAEDYFFIAYEYCVIRKDRAEGVKYAAISKEKKNFFSNKFIQLYNDHLMDFYYTYVEKDDSTFNKLDNDFKSITIDDWNKYPNLLNSKLGLCANFDGGIDYIINQIEYILIHEEKLDPGVIVPLKDTLVAVYYQKGYYARILEISLETKVLLQNYDVKYGDAYKARAFLNEASVYTILSDNNRAEKLLEEALEIDIENKILERDTKVTIIEQLISIYLTEDHFDKIPDLINSYNDFMTHNDAYNSDELYYLSLAEYHIKKYEKDKSPKDLNMAEYYIELSKKCFSGNIGARNINIDTHKSVYAIYLEYLKGNAQYALDQYKELLNNLTDKALEVYILKNMYNIYLEQGRYKEANEYCVKISNIKAEESLLISQDYSAYSTKKYEAQLEIRKINKEKKYNYIKWFCVILVLTIIIIIIVIKNTTLRKNNITDALTKIYNRLYFNEVYAKKLDKHDDFSICIIDIDNFKQINDNYGHLIGDKVLKRVAKILKEAVGNSGDVFRYGGEEFVVVLNIKNKLSIINIAENMRKEVESSIWDKDLIVTISMGVADSAIEKENVLQVADNRLYISKTTGKNKITFDN